MGGCFSVPWLGGVLIWLVVICGFIAIVMLILPIVYGCFVGGVPRFR
jgi:hypothetical protein